jgi:hypothetical protein
VEEAEELEETELLVEEEIKESEEDDELTEEAPQEARSNKVGTITTSLFLFIFRLSVLS